MFFRKKKLFEQDPATLPLDLLGRLQISLIAKLILVNDDLRRRYDKLSTLATDIPDGEAAKNVFGASSQRLERLNAALRVELDHATGARRTGPGPAHS